MLQALVVFAFFCCFLGLPRPAGGSGCFAARKPARPCAAKGGWVWPAATAVHPSAEALRALAAASPPPIGPKIGYRKKCHGLGTENTQNVS